MKYKTHLIICLALIIIASLFIIGCTVKTQELNLVADEKVTTTTNEKEVNAATGWSNNNDYNLAISEAVTEAKEKLGGKTPTFAYVIYISESNHEKIINQIRTQIGPDVKIFGYTSNLIITEEGLIKADKFAVAVLLVADPNLTIGIGTVDLASASTPEEAGKTALLNSIADAGKEKTDVPDMILYMGTSKRGEENQVMNGMAEIVGRNVPVIGGNAKDFSAKVVNNWRQFTDKESFDNGLLIATVYTEKPVGWGFESTFGLTDKRGIVTKSDGFRIVEIDGRPALDVYDEWVGGEFYRKLNAGEFNSAEEVVDFNLVKNFTLLNPIAKIVKGDNNQIGHFASSPIPDAQDIKNKTISVYAQISEGDEISLYKGTWQIAMNRAETIPKDALLRSGLSYGQGTFAVMVVCNGLKTIIPEEELVKMGPITESILGVPFIGGVTAGEQGPIPGIGNVNANIVESIVLFG